MKARETYGYGYGRNSYLNNQTNKSYQYLTDQSGSVTGLTQDGEAVASSTYKLYGSTKKSTDETGNPYAYNGEARDNTGLDYLRARYYDSHAGTFLTEDSYQGEARNPLARHAVDTVGETAVDTIVDATQGGKVTPGSIAASFAINAISEGVSARAPKGPKADVAKNKPKSGDVPVTKPRKDVTPVQQLALPGPTSKPLALPAPKQQLALPAPEPVLALPAPKPVSKPDFYVAPDGTTLPATGYRYMDSKYADQTIQSMQAPGSYMGFSKFDSAKQVQGAYQISPTWSDAKLRGEFDTLQIFGNVKVPRAYGDKVGEVLEPLTTSYPEFGKGGYPQLITDKTKNIDFTDVTIIGD